MMSVIDVTLTVKIRGLFPNSPNDGEIDNWLREVVQRIDEQLAGHRTPKRLSDFTVVRVESIEEK